MKRIIVGITGASGAIYAKRFLETARGEGEIHVVYSNTAPLVFKEELHMDLPAFLKTLDYVKVHKNKDFLSPLASGSNSFDTYVVLPCSMKTLGQLSHGVGETLLTRIGDIALKERRQLVLVPREAPYSTVHLENMLRISNLGGIILPASPGFYHQPQSLDDVVDFIVSRVRQLIGFTSIMKSWKQEEIERE